MDLLQSHALALNVIDELMKHSTMHPQKEKVYTVNDVFSMGDHEIVTLAFNTLEKLVTFPNIAVLKELLRRFDARLYH